MKEPEKEPMKISFCTTCMGRTPHLRQTLIQNIKDNLPKNPGDPDVEFVVVDYNSKDGLRKWMESDRRLRRYIKNGTLVYRQYLDADHFHHAHAKNMAHRLATGDVVCNVDADNFIGRGFARHLADKFADGTHALIHPAFSTLASLPSELSGCFGRIAMLREDFLALGGYSETRFKKGWGFEDTDLITRALAYGLKVLPIFDKTFLKVIAHTNEERVKNTAGGTTAQEAAKVNSGRARFKQLRFTFREYVSSVQANRDGKLGKFGMGTVLEIGNNEPQKIEAIESFARISKRGIHARRPLQADYALAPPQKPKVTLNAG